MNKKENESTRQWNNSLRVWSDTEVIPLLLLHILGMILAQVLERFQVPNKTLPEIAFLLEFGWQFLKIGGKSF